MRRARWCCPSDSKPKPKPKPNLNPNPKPNPKPKPKPKPKPNPNQVLPVRFEATKRSQHAADSSVCDRGRPDSSVEARLARAVQLALLLLRRSVAGCAVGSLQLHQHSAADLRLLLPLCLGASEALGRQEPRLLSLTLTLTLALTLTLTLSRSRGCSR